MFRRLAATGIASALLAVAALATALPASAHAALVSQTPADGEALAAAPAEVILVFNEAASAIGNEVEVLAPDGANVAEGEPALDDVKVTQVLAPDLPPGAYTVNWRVTSADGHPISGTSTFTVAAAEPTSTPEPSATEAPEDASPSADADAGADATAGAGPDDGAAASDEPTLDEGSPWRTPLLVVFGLAIIGAIVTLVIRLRRSGGDARSNGPTSGQD